MEQPPGDLLRGPGPVGILVGELGVHDGPQGDVRPASSNDVPLSSAAEDPVAGRGLLAAPLQDQVVDRSQLLRLLFSSPLSSPAVLLRR
jgi:hypothetical protein